MSELTARIKHKYLYWSILYAALFLCLLPLVFFLFFKYDISMVWKADGLTQHSISILYLGEWLREIGSNLIHGRFSIPLYTFRISQGMDIPAYYSTWYYDFVYWIFAPFTNIKNITVIYTVIICVKLFLAGWSFLYFCYYHKQEVLPSLTGALMYAYSGYSLCVGLCHPHFMQGMYFLPLMLIGVEKIVKKDSMKWFLLIVTAALMGSYYFTYMNCFLCFFYFWILIVCSRKSFRDTMRAILKVVASLVIAFMSCGALLLPAAYALLHSTRGTGELSYESLIWYNIEHPIQVFYSWVTPDFSLGTSSYHVSCAAIVLVMVMVLFMQKDRYRIQKMAFAVIVIGSLIPLFGYSSAVFSKITNRWTYAVAFFLCWNTVSMLPKIFTLTRKQLALCLLPAVFYVYFYKYMKSYIHNINGDKKTILILTAMMVLPAALFGLIRLSGMNRSLAYLMIMAAVLLCIPIDSYMTFSPRFSGRVNVFEKKEDCIRRLSGDFNSKRLQEEIETLGSGGLYRSDVGYIPVTVYTNGPLISGRLSTGVHHSTVDDDLMQMYLNTENPGVRLSCNLYDLDGRIVSESLASVRHYIVRKGEEGLVPYGCRFRSSVRDGDQTYLIYEKADTLPFGFTYRELAEESRIKDFGPVEKEEIMAHAAVLEEAVEGMDAYQPELQTSSEIPAIEMENVSDDGKGIYESRGAGKLKLSFKGREGCETFVRLKGISCDRIKSAVSTRIDLVVKTDHVKKRAPIFGRKYPYNPGYKNISINLGWSDKAQTGCEILFPREGKYEIREIEVYYMPLDTVETAMQSLADESLQDLKLETNHIEGNIHADGSRILCLSLPYSDGWTVKVDGTKTDTFRVDYGYTGCLLPSGDHHVSMEYMTPGLLPGLALGAAGLACLVIVFITDEGKRKIKRGKK